MKKGSLVLLQRHHSDVAPGVDLTPIIDIVFLLLIFFLVATTFQQTEREMSVALPSSRNAGPISATLRELVVNVMPDGAMVVSGRSVQEEDLRTIIQNARQSNPDQKVSIRADRATPYEAVARTLDIIKGAGVSQPYLDTVPARSQAGGA